MLRNKRLLRVVIGIVLVLLVFVVLQKMVSVDKIFAVGGIIGMGLTLFAETGLLAGFFLPGDTLLFAAGFFAAQGRLSLPLTLFVLSLSAVLGNMAGYEIGKRNGHKLFNKPDSLLFHKQNIDKAQDFFSRHGGKTVIMARFIPIVRTLTSPLAGMARMPYGQFMTYNIIGAVLWVPSLTLIGFWVGKAVGKYINIDHYILPAALLATVLTFGGSFAHLLRDPATRKQLFAKIKRGLQQP